MKKIKKIEKTYIYALKDPHTLDIRYVGKSNNPRKRLSKHVRDCFNLNRKNTHKQNWIRKLLNDDVNNFKNRPTLEILEIVDCDKWEQREIYWINKFRKEGCNLTNIESGGNSPINLNLCKKVAKINFITNEIEDIYESIAEACRRNGYSSNGRVSDCCNGKIQKSNGYIWRFLDDDNNIIYESVKTFKSKKVAKLNLELEIIKIYPTLHSVSEDGYDCSFVHKVCNGKYRSRHGYIWRFLDGDNSIIVPKILYKKRTVAKYSLNGKYIKTYLNTESAAKEIGLSSGESIRNSINNSNRISSGGYVWKYNDY